MPELDWQAYFAGRSGNPFRTQFQPYSGDLRDYDAVGEHLWFRPSVEPLPEPTPAGGSPAQSGGTVWQPPAFGGDTGGDRPGNSLGAPAPTSSANRSGEGQVADDGGLKDAPDDGISLADVGRAGAMVGSMLTTGVPSMALGLLSSAIAGVQDYDEAQNIARQMDLATFDPSYVKGTLAALTPFDKLSFAQQARDQSFDDLTDRAKGFHDLSAFGWGPTTMGTYQAADDMMSMAGFPGQQVGSYAIHGPAPDFFAQIASQVKSFVDQLMPSFSAPSVIARSQLSSARRLGVK